MLQPGTAIGDYRVVRKLGEGGMGEVYLAVHEILRQRVVLKGLHPEYLADTGLRDRLRREAEAMARLSHPNIVALYNFIETDEGAFIAMEYVDGSTLDELLHRHGPAPLARVIDLIRPALAALDYAHMRGVIHRDLKPANIMLGVDGYVRVMDFGTAKVIDRPGLTRVGMTLGTATYMPPEQVMGRDLTPATDVYAMGVTLFELVTGHLPFESDDTSELMKRICTEAAPAPSLYVPSLPKSFDALIARCLAKRAADRYQSASEILVALEKIAGEIGASGAARTPPPSGPRAALSAAAGAAAGAVPAPARVEGVRTPSPATAVHDAIDAVAAPAGGAVTDGAFVPGWGVAMLGVLLSGLGLAAALGAIGLLRLGHGSEGQAVSLAAIVLWALGSAALGWVALSRARQIERTVERSAALAGGLAALREAAASAAAHPSREHPAARTSSVGSYGWALQQATVAARPVPSGGDISAWRHRPFDGRGEAAADPGAAPGAAEPAATWPAGHVPARTVVASVAEREAAKI